MPADPHFATNYTLHAGSLARATQGIDVGNTGCPKHMELTSEQVGDWSVLGPGLVSMIPLCIVLWVSSRSDVPCRCRVCCRELARVHALCMTRPLLVLPSGSSAAAPADAPLPPILANSPPPPLATHRDPSFHRDTTFSPYDSSSPGPPNSPIFIPLCPQPHPSRRHHLLVAQ